jgi:hypothetical protein
MADMTGTKLTFTLDDETRELRDAIMLFNQNAPYLIEGINAIADLVAKENAARDDQAPTPDQEGG